MGAMESVPVTADLTLMRELNQALILNLVRQEGQISRAEIAKRTNLSRSTVSNIVNELIGAGRIFEIQKGESRGGRRPILLELNYRSHCVIGVEIATAFVNLVVSDLNAVILYQCCVPFDIGVGPDVTVARVQDLIQGGLSAVGINPSQVAGVGIGIPGPLYYAAGQIIAPPIMPGWNGVALRDLFETVLPFPVVVDNDANLGAIAEYRLGAAQGIRNVAYIYLGSAGIGGGLVLNGAIYRGEIGSAGEIGHLTIDEDGPPCTCGSFGCLEAVAGMPTVLRRAAELFGGQRMTLDQLVEEAHSGTEAVQALFVSSAKYVGIAVASLLNVCNPGLVVLGGPFSAAGDLLLETVRSTARKRALPIALKHCEIVAGALGANAVALGAASQIIQMVFSPTTLDTLVGQL